MNTTRFAFRTLGVLVLTCLAAVPAGAQTTGAAAAKRPGASLATDLGCMNCHGASARGDAPPFQRLQERAVRLEGEARRAKMDHWLEEMRETGRGWKAVVAHRQVSDATARALVQWLAGSDVPAAQ